MSLASHSFLATGQTTRPIGDATKSGRCSVAGSEDDAAVMGVANVVCGARAAEIAAKGQQGFAAARQTPACSRRSPFAPSGKWRPLFDEARTRKVVFAIGGRPRREPIGARGASFCRKHGRRERFRRATNQKGVCIVSIAKDCC
jgi:hypothetical protein